MRRIVGMLGAAAAALSLSACGPPGTLAEQWDGTSWTLNPTTNPASWTDSILNGVSCKAASACMAVGTYDTGSGNTATRLALSEQWDGSSWTVQPTANPAGSVYANLNGVSCTSPTACTAVGFYGSDQPLAERWDGTNWTVQPTPSPAGSSGVVLNGVSCTSATACIAVGDTSNTDAHGVSTGLPLAEVWDGTSWTTQTIPKPAGSPNISLNGVSCTSATVCIAVGYVQINGAGNIPLAERWDGTSWTVQTTPNPTTSTSSELSGVSCTSATTCIAVGTYDTSGTNVNLLQLVERWDGTSWTIQATPQQQSVLHGVSCTSDTACTAVGSYVSSTTTNGPPLAEVWDGTSWTTQTIPNEPGRTWGLLNAVFCTSVSACATVGHYNN